MDLDLVLLLSKPSLDLDLVLRYLLDILPSLDLLLLLLSDLCLDLDRVLELFESLDLPLDLDLLLVLVGLLRSESLAGSSSSYFLANETFLQVEEEQQDFQKPQLQLDQNQQNHLQQAPVLIREGHSDDAVVDLQLV